MSEATPAPGTGARAEPEVRRSPAPDAVRKAPARTIIVESEHAGRRLDKFLRSRLKGVPAGLLFRLLRQGRLRVNGRKAQQGYRLQEGDEISLPRLRVEATTSPDAVPPALLEQLQGAVLHEDEDLLIIDKPAGMAVHKGTDVPAGVIEALRQLRPELPELELSHRLDRETSGVLALAKTPSMLRYLHDLLRDREEEIERHYLALVAGRWPAERTVIDAPLRRADDRVVVDPGGQRAETRVSVRQRFGSRATLLDVRLLSGRKHQIRVHLHHAGHPVAGDDRYGDPRFNRRVTSLGQARLYLHATQLVVPKPEGPDLVVSSPVPHGWDELLRDGL